MKTKLVKETLNEFQQGGDPYEKMKLGKYSDFRHGDKYIDKNDNILTYDSDLDEFWYDVPYSVTRRYTNAQYIRENPSTFTKIN